MRNVQKLDIRFRDILPGWIFRSGKTVRVTKKVAKSSIGAFGIRAKHEVETTSAEILGEDFDERS